jgi:UDP-N-acetylglucosamine--N-acetylmuramyl-(pentapeptide) pyrophosphoryl-undecaprenol N-acetylglucosamine transferase
MIFNKKTHSKFAINHRFFLFAYNNSMKTIVLTGGGTAGHVMPNMALLPELKKHFDKIEYIGTDGIEKQITAQYGLPFHTISATKLVRKSVLKNLALPFKLFCSIRQCKKILKQVNPQIVFSKGGFVSLPVVIAAKKLGIPVISHESDLTMGVANKVISKYASLMLTSFSSTAKGKKFLFAGSPIRKEIYLGDKQKAFSICGFKTHRTTLLVFGGSLGAKALNQLVLQSLPELTKRYNVIHITGKGGTLPVENNDAYYQMEFANQIEHFFALADIVITRGGANSLFELLALKKPMLIVPLPKGNSRGDQVENAKYFAQKGWAIMAEQETLNSKKLVRLIDNMPTQKLIQAMKANPHQNPNQKFVEIIVKYANKHA